MQLLAYYETSAFSVDRTYGAFVLKNYGSSDSAAVADLFEGEVDVDVECVNACLILVYGYFSGEEFAVSDLDVSTDRGNNFAVVVVCNKRFVGYDFDTVNFVCVVSENRTGHVEGDSSAAYGVIYVFSVSSGDAVGAHLYRSFDLVDNFEYLGEDLFDIGAAGCVGAFAFGCAGAFAVGSLVSGSGCHCFGSGQGHFGCAESSIVFRDLVEHTGEHTESSIQCLVRNVAVHTQDHICHVSEEFFEVKTEGAHDVVESRELDIKITAGDVACCVYAEFIREVDDKNVGGIFNVDHLEVEAVDSGEQCADYVGILLVAEDAALKVEPVGVEVVAVFALYIIAFSVFVVNSLGESSVCYSRSVDISGKLDIVSLSGIFVGTEGYLSVERKVENADVCPLFFFSFGCYSGVEAFNVTESFVVGKELSFEGSGEVGVAERGSDNDRIVLFSIDAGDAYAAFRACDFEAEADACKIVVVVFTLDDYGEVGENIVKIFGICDSDVEIFEDLAYVDTCEVLKQVSSRESSGLKIALLRRVAIMPSGLRRSLTLSLKVLTPSTSV